MFSTSYISKTVKTEQLEKASWNTNNDKALTVSYWQYKQEVTRSG